MKFLTNRTEIAEAINVNRYPVLTIDCTKEMEGYADCYEGSKINLRGGRSKGYEDLLTRCTVKMFGDEPGNECHFAPWTYKRIILQGGIVGLHASFGLRDVLEDIEWSNARVAAGGDKVVVFFRAAKAGFLRLMKISDHIDPHCSTVATLVDIDE